MTDSDQTEPAPHEEDPVTPPPADEPGYYTETGEAVGEDGTVVPIIGGLPAVEGSSWDIGAATDERGANLAEEMQRNEQNQADLSAAGWFTTAMDVPLVSL